MDFVAPFGRWMKERRRSLDMTQAELARRVHYSSVAISKMEAGALIPSRQGAEALADALQIPAADRVAFAKFARGIAVTPPYFSLPAETTPLIGRERDVAAVLDLLGSPGVRLVNLVGPPGVGKTRLALACASRAIPAFLHGSLFVSLAAITDPARAGAGIASRLGLPPAGDQPFADVLTRYLCDKQLLLVLDNFEQITPAAPLLADLLAAAPALKMLVTSRVVLRLSGEHVYNVAPLTLPDTEDLSDLAAVEHCPAVALFLQCARAVKPTLALTPANVYPIAQICHYLDGLPLAIELAASRMRMFTAPTLFDRLNHTTGARLRFLTTGSYDLPPRQQTLRDTIEWSYRLLGPHAQQTFRRATVFTGGFTLDAAQAVCGEADEAAELTLETLVNHNLVQQSEDTAGAPRYSLLETLRDFALEQLNAQSDSSEAELVRRRHARFFAQMCDLDIGSPAWPTQSTAIMRQLATECDNLYAALAWVRQRDDEPLMHLNLVFALAWLVTVGTNFVGVRGRGEDFETELEQLLARNPDLTAAKRGWVLHSIGLLATMRGDTSKSMRLYAESMAICHAAGDRGGEAVAAHLSGWRAYKTGDIAQAERFFARLLELGHQMGETAWTVNAIYMLGELALARGDIARAEPLLYEALPIFRKQGMQTSIGGGEAAVLRDLGGVAYLRGDYTRAYELIEQGLRMFEEANEPQRLAEEYQWLGQAALALNELDLAEQHIKTCARLTVQYSYMSRIRVPLALLAHIAMRQGRLVYAARLAGWVAIDPHTSFFIILKPDINEMLEQARACLVNAEFATAWAEGQALTLDQALAYALNG
jgi:predicted ATPase/DNA-binding XRE family transcriptional regulator